MPRFLTLTRSNTEASGVARVWRPREVHRAWHAASDTSRSSGGPGELLSWRLRRRVHRWLSGAAFRGGRAPLRAGWPIAKRDLFGGAL